MTPIGDAAPPAPRGRSPWLAFGVVGLGVALLFGLWLLFAPERKLGAERTAAFSKLRVGMARDEVVAALGTPDCSGEGGTALGNVRDQAARERLTAETRSYFVYAFGRSERSIAPCSPAYLDGRVGFDANDRVLWYDALLGETYAVHGGP